MKLKNDFEQFLAEKFDGLFHGTKDEIENAFDSWLSNLDGQEYIDYANEFGARLTEQLIKEIDNYFKDDFGSKDKLRNKYLKE